METTVELISPQIASTYLKHNNTRNRNMSQGHVNKLAATMKDGKWKDSHQGIAFYADGTLADGQHRLSAIIKSGQTIKLMVTRGLPNESESAVDQQARTRTLADSLVMEGFDMCHTRVAVARHWLRLLGNGNPANHEIREFLECHKHALDTVLNNTGRDSIWKHASISTVLAIAVEKGYAEQVVEWMNVMRTGIATPEQSAAIRFRDFWLTGTKASGGGALRQEWSRRVYSSLKAFIERRPLAKLYAAERIEWLRQEQDSESPLDNDE